MNCKAIFSHIYYYRSFQHKTHNSERREQENLYRMIEKSYIMNQLLLNRHDKLPACNTFVNFTKAFQMFEILCEHID